MFLDEPNWQPKGSNGWGPLHLAAACGDMKGLVLLLDHLKEDDKEEKLSFGSPKGANVKQSRLELEASSGDRALHVALRNGQVLAARELIRAGCSAHSRGRNGETAAHICAAEDLAEELQHLQKSFKVDPTALTDRGETIVHIAARNCRISFLEWVRAQPFATPKFFASVSKSGETCLHEVARCGNRIGVQWLLEYIDRISKMSDENGVSNFMIQNKAGKSPVDVARAAAHFQVCKMLEEFQMKKGRERKFRRQAEKRFILAARNGDLKALQTLARKHSKNFSIVDSLHQKTRSPAVLIAAENGCLEAVRWLLSYSGRRQLVNERTGETILHRAVHGGNIELLKVLASKSFINLEDKNNRGATAHQVAKDLGKQQEILDILCATKDGKAKSSNKDTIVQASTDPAESQRQPGNATPSTLPESATSATRDPAIRARKRLESEKLRDWLLALDMVEWFDKLCEEGFDSLPRLCNLEDEDLVDMGMKKGYRRSFMKAVVELVAEPPTTVQGALPSEDASTVSTNGSSKSADGPWTEAHPAGTLTGRKGDFYGNTKESNSVADLFQSRELEEGEELCINSRTSGNKYNPSGLPRQYILRRIGQHLYECTCAEWRLQNNTPKCTRTCQHLKEFRGENAELRRIDWQRTLHFNMSAVLDEISQFKPQSSGEGEGEGEGERESIARQRLRIGKERSSSGSKRKPSRGSGSGSSTHRKPSSVYAGVPSHQILSWEELTFGQIIGEGSFGIVRAAEWRGMLVAVKELRGNEKLVLTGSTTSLSNYSTSESPSEPSKQESSEEFDLKHEAAMMSRVSHHENIVPFVGVLLTPRPCVVTKLMRRGSVEDMLVVPGGPLYRRQRLESERVIEMLIDAAAGILHLHSEGVIHRDIAARNLLVDENFRVRVADFGFARIKEINQSKGFTNTSIGPIKWMAPEAMRFRTFSEQSDAFSFGVTLYEVAVGRRPWSDVQSMDVVYRVCQGERLTVLEHESCVTGVGTLVEKCQAPNPDDRPTMKQVHIELQGLRQRDVSMLRRAAVMPPLDNDTRGSNSYVPLISRGEEDMARPASNLSFYDQLPPMEEPSAAPAYAKFDAS